MAYETIQLVPVLRLNLFGPRKTELWAKEIEGFSIIASVMWENRLVGILLPTNMAAAI